jgi:hypothetical protein
VGTRRKITSIIIIIIIIIITKILPHAGLTDPKVTRTSEKRRREYNVLSFHGEKIQKFPQQEILCLDKAACPIRLVCRRTEH